MLVALLACCAQSVSYAAEAPPAIEVTVFNVAGVSDETLRAAQSEITSVYGRARFQLSWAERQSTARDRRELGDPLYSVIAHKHEICSDAAAYSIVIQLSDRFHPGYRSNALGFSLPFAPAGVRITVFYDRIERLARNVRLPLQRVLAAMLAHELGHVLIGTDGHFEGGLLRKCWDYQHLAKLTADLPALSAREIGLMNRRLNSWKRDQLNCATSPAKDPLSSGQ